MEAARAGDAGRGFAVVATEVRALAQRSTEAARRIKGLISTSSGQVSHGVDLVRETGQALGRIVDAVTEINGLVSDIAAGAAEQSTGLSHVNAAIARLDQITQRNAAMVEETTAAARDLAIQTREVAERVERFRVGPAAAPDGPTGGSSGWDRPEAAGNLVAHPARDRGAALRLGGDATLARVPGLANAALRSA